MAREDFQPSKTIALRRQLRSGMTETEKILWSQLRRKNLGYKFSRQYGVGRYILDFYCAEKKLAIEIDGSQHAEEKNLIHDQKRTGFLNKNGITVLRFWNTDIFNNLETVLDVIKQKLEEC